MSGDDKIDKLIDTVSKQSEFLTMGDKHSTDATELKKEWFNYVLLSLEKAREAIDGLEKEQHIASKDLLKGLMKAREDLRTEMIDLRSSYDGTLEKVEFRVEKSLDSLREKVDLISIPAVRQELKAEVNNLKGEILTEIGKTKEDLRVKDIDPLKSSVNTLLVKVAGIGVVGGLIGSFIVALLAILMKSVIASWLGIPTP